MPGRLLLYRGDTQGFRNADPSTLGAPSEVPWIVSPTIATLADAMVKKVYESLHTADSGDCDPEKVRWTTKKLRPRNRPQANDYV